MIRKTLANAKDPSQCGIAEVANLSPSDNRFVALLNQATQNLVQSGEPFYGLHQRIQFCITSGCLVLPRQIAAVETAALCDHPIPIRNRWFEFLDTGVGLRTESDCDSGCGCGSGGNGLLDRGEVCAFTDIIGTNKKIKVYTDVTEDVDAVILLQGYDENNQWIRTQVGGVWIDGEQVSLFNGPHTSTKFFTSLTGTQKPLTNGTVRLYEYDTTLTTQRDMAIYEPDEINPTYRKMFLSALEGASCCGCSDDDPQTAQVTVMARLEFIPVANDRDWLLIGNFSALEAEVQSIQKRRNNLIEESMACHVLALQTLRNELRHYLGRGAVTPMRMQPRNLAGAAVYNMI
jgi:hypothetical protein